jgi:CPA1 family monovalent cation:H+ antiporter
VRSLVIWDLVTIVINGLVFLLIGLEIGDLADKFDRKDLLTAIGYSAATVATMMAVRFAYVYGMAAMGRRRKGKPSTAEGGREQFVVAWSGLRGVVSLATALALPLITDSGERFDHRDQIILITAFVVVLTLFGLGLPLPWILRHLQFAKDENDGAETRLAIKAMSEAMYAQYLVESERMPDAEPLLRPILDRMLGRMQRAPDATEISMLEHDPLDDAGIQQRAINAAREALLGLRDRGQIGDEVLRQMERRLDLQELQLMA